ncbi:MAG: helix-hairpin-helix domain-containing protein [Flavobacteriales bacterium]
MPVLEFISQALELKTSQIQVALNFFEQAFTIPFIARYRKDETGNLNEVQLADIQKLKKQFEELEARKKHIKEQLKTQHISDVNLLKAIDESKTLAALNLLFEPYKITKHSLFDRAQKAGLQTCVSKLLSKTNVDVERLAQQNCSSEFKTKEEVLQGFEALIEHEVFKRHYIQTFENAKKHGLWTSVLKKGVSEEEANKFKTVLNLEKRLQSWASHQFLALERAKEQKVISVKLVVDNEFVISKLKAKLYHSGLQQSDFVEASISKAFKKKMHPKLTKDLWKICKQKADEEAIAVFSKNLNQLLLSSPLGEKRVMGIDPGFRSGCKVVCLDAKGHLLFNETFYPHSKSVVEKEKAGKKLRRLIETYKVEALAIGDGTAGKETLEFAKKQTTFLKIPVFSVDESGASVYSASAVARAEFPDYDITVRGAVSIARRLMDPLSELIKIDPKALGVGQYQHAVDQKKLGEALDFSLKHCVNQVGLNLNTASAEALKSISGLSPSLAKRIVEHRKVLGKFINRNQLKEVKGLGEKTFQQAAAFLKIFDGEQQLDQSFVHPEQYQLLAELCQLSLDEDLKVFQTKIATLDHDAIPKNSIGKLAFEDLKTHVLKPNLDPRKPLKLSAFSNKIKTFDDLFVGQKLTGRVKNITNFGCFVDIGIKENALLHISKMAKQFVSDVHSIVQLNQVLEVSIINLETETKRIGISLIES